MTVPASSRRAGPFTGNGVAVNFPFAFKVFGSAGLAVVRAASGVETTLVEGPDYTVALNPDQDASPGGTVTLTTALATGQTLAIVGAEDYDQGTDLPTGGKYSAVVVENALDKLTILLQQLLELTGRALTLPATSAGASATLPVPVAGNVIGWDATATALRNIDPTTLASIVAYANRRTLVANGGAASYTLAADPGNASNTMVAVSGVVQTPGVDYTVSGVTLTPTTPWPAGTGNVVIVYGEALPTGVTDATVVNFLQAGALAKPRTAQSKLRDGVSALDFGADPTGAVDSTAAIQAAINTGKAVYLPAGTYTISTLYFNANGQGLIGESPATTILSSTVSSGGEAAIKSSNQTTTRLFCFIKNIQVNASLLVTGYAVDWKSMQFGRIENVWVYGGGTNCTGIRLDANWVTTECTYNTIENCYIGNVTKGVSFGDGANTNTLIGNRIQPLATGYGYFVFGTAAGRVSNNTIVGGGVEYAGAVSRGVYAGQGCDVLTIVGVRFEYLAVGIESTASANGLYLFGNYFSSCNADYALLSTATIRVENQGLELPNAAATSTTALDYYQRGTFTPTVKGSSTAGAGTYTVQAGSYTRIGNRVFFELNVNISAHTGTGNLQIDGLPFTQKNQAFNYSYSVAAENLTFTNTLRALGLANTTTIALYSQSSNAGLAAVSMDPTCSIYVSGSYPV